MQRGVLCYEDCGLRIPNLVRCAARGTLLISLSLLSIVWYLLFGWKYYWRWVWIKSVGIMGLSTRSVIIDFIFKFNKWVSSQFSTSRPTTQLTSFTSLIRTRFNLTLWTTSIATFLVPQTRCWPLKETNSNQQSTNTHQNPIRATKLTNSFNKTWLAWTVIFKLLKDQPVSPQAAPQ